MAKIHVMTGDGISYAIVVHGPAPAGNNAVGISWSEAIVAAGRNVSSMEVGTGPGQIAQAEFDEIVAGNVMEGSFTFTNNPTGWTPAQRNAALDAQADHLISSMQAYVQENLRYYGVTRN